MVTPTGPRRTRPRTPLTVVHLPKGSTESLAVREPITAPTKVMVRSNSAAASDEFLQISHMRALTMLSREGLRSSTKRSMAAIRSASDIWGQRPWPLSQALAAASTACTESASLKAATLPITARLPVSKSTMGLVTSVVSPLNSILSPATNLKQPSMLGLALYATSDALTLAGRSAGHLNAPVVWLSSARGLGTSPVKPGARSLTPSLDAGALSMGCRNLALASTPSASFRFTSLSGKAAMVSTENARKASVTDMVPIALERRPEKGKTSGPRLHWALRLMRPTTAESMSTKDAAAPGSRVKIAACCPFQDARTAASTSEALQNLAMGTTGPNCSSPKTRIVGSTG
mmetsp:Transcript_23283/g.64512  ORF Transcript_23283/g.64512 Transcript_23283/m.64512 type:complete len:346 (+) Transcript_23283:821-1858(+)